MGYGLGQPRNGFQLSKQRLIDTNDLSGVPHIVLIICGKMSTCPYGWANVFSLVTPMPNQFLYCTKVASILECI